MLDPFAAHTEQVEKSHFVDEFGSVIRVEEDVLAQFTLIEVLGHKPTVFRSILTPIVRFIDLHVLMVFVVIERNGEVNLLRKYIVDLFSVIIDNIKVVIFGSLASIHHMKMFYL